MCILTQINEHLFAFITYFHFYKTSAMFCMIYSFYLKRTILITFNGEENTCLLTRTLSGQEIMGMLNFLNIYRDIWLKGIL